MDDPLPVEVPDILLAIDPALTDDEADEITQWLIGPDTPS